MNPDRIMTMRYLVIVLAVSGCVSVEPAILFQDAGVGAASTSSDYLDRPIKVCGQVVSDLRGPNGEWVLSHRGRYSMSWLVVDASAGPLQPGGEACVRGVVRGARISGVEDMPDFERVLYPCSDAASCRAAGAMIRR
jgi:hypothetical protein